MAVNSETIEIRLSGLDRIRELERRLLSIEGIANSLSGAIDEVGTGLQRGLSALQRNVREARALRTTRAAAQDVLNNPRAARALGRTGRRQLQEQIERQGRLLSDVYEPAIRSLGQAVREGRAQQRAMQTQRRQVASLTTGIGDDITQTYSQLGDTQEQVIRQLRGTRRRTRVAGTRALIEARRDDARRLAGSSNLLTGNLVQRDRNITAQTAAVNRRIDTLERSELSARRAAGAQARSLRRQQTAARSSGDIIRVGRLQNEIQEIGRNLARELDTLQSTRSSLATELGRLNQGRRSLGAISRGRSTVSRAGESIRRRARELEEVYGVRPSELSVNIGGRQTRIDRATRRAGLEANVRDNIEGAKTILKLAANRVTSLERELGLNNKIQDAEQKRANTIQRLSDKLESLRASRAAGPQMQNFENLFGQLQRAANTRNMPQFNRLAASAKAAADSAASALATEQKRQNLLTQNNKALRSIDLSQSQLSELQSRGAGNLLSFQTAQTAASRLPQLQQAGNFDEFRLALTDFTAALRIARGELSARQRNFTGGQRLQGILGEFDAILSQLPANARIRGGVESRRRAFGASGAAALQAGDVAGFNIEATSAAKRTAELRTQVQNEKRRLDLISSGQKKEQELLALQSKGVNVTALLGTLRSAIARAQQVSYEFIARETNELDRQVASSKRLLLVENQRLKATGSGTQSPTALIDRVAKLGGRFSSLVGGGAVPENLVAPIRKSLIGIAAAAKQGTTPLDELKTRLDRLSTRISSFKTISGTVQDPSTLINQVAKAGTKFSGLVSGGAVPSNLVKPLRDALTGIASSARNGSRPISELKGELDRLLTRISAFRLPTAAQDPTALISRIGKAGAKFTDLVGAGAVPQNLVDPIRKSLREIGSAARQGSTPLSELAARLTKLSARISSFTKPSTADPTSIIKGVSSFGASLSGIQSSGLVADSTISNLRKSLIDIAKAARSGSAPLDKLKSDLASLGVSITSLGQNVKRSQRGIDVQLEKILGAAAIGGPLGRGRTGQQALDAIGAIPGVNLARPSMMSTINIEKVAAALGTLRNGLDRTSAEFKQLDPVLRRLQKRLADQASRRDPNADFLTRGLGQRNAQGLSEGIIGGAFPLLFGQGLGASIGGGLGGFLGGRAGGMLGFGLSLVGTSIGTQADALMQATQDTGNMLRDLVGNFEQIKESGLLASRSQEKLIGNLLEAGNKTAAYAIIQDELNRKLGVDGAAKLREAADAGDRLKRAMADLGIQIQLLVAGPLTDILNAIAKGLEGRNKISSVGDTFNKVPASKQKELLDALASANIQVGASPASNRVLFTNTPFGGISTNPNGGGSESRGDLFRRLTSNLNQQQIQGVFDKFLPTATAGPETAQQQRDRAIRDAETRQAAAQRELEVFNKRNEGVDILKGFKQQANAIRREQEDINRQSFELRRDYEKQIEDIRRGVEEKISQIRQENAQKELEILVKQGQIREQQFKNAATTLQGALAGDPLAQSLADAVTTYLGAQLSAQNEIEQRRKQFEIEINNQQVELEKYKLDVARTISRLNTDTVEKVAQINLGIARRNEDAALNVFATEKKTAELRLRGIKSDLEGLRTQEESSLAGLRSQLLADTFNPALLQVIKNYEARITEINKGLQDQQKILNEVSTLQAPPKLQSIAPAATKGVSLAGVNAQKARGDQLRAQFQAFSDELTGLVETGNFAEFTNRISEIGRGGFDELSNNLDTARKELALVGGDFGPIAQGITDAYQKVIDDLPRLAAKLTPELQAQVPALKKYLEAAKQSQIQLEKLRPTLEFYITGYGDLKSQTEQAKNGISELLSPTKNYDRLLEQINKRGGLGINEEETRRLLQAARNLDELNAKLKVLNGLNDIAGGWTDSFIQLNKELLKGGNLLESVQRFAEGVADRTLDVVLEFTLRPIQEQLFKNLSKVLGIEAPQDPTLLPIKETAQNTKDLVDLQKRQFAGQTGIKLPEAANNIVAAPSTAPAAPAFDTGMRTGPAGRIGSGTAYHQDIMFGSGVSLEERVKYMDQLARGYEAMGRVIEFSNAGVANRRYLSTDPIEKRRQLILDAQAAHANRPGGSGRAAMDFYAPLAGQTRFGPSVEGQVMLAPVVPGGTPSYSSGGGAGRKMTMMKDGQMIYEMLHGDTGVPLAPASRTELGPQGSARPPIGDQFASQILGGQFEDVAGLQPLPLQRMYRQMGRQVRRWTDMIQNEARYILKRDFGTDKPLIPQDIIDKTVDRVRTLTNTIQGFDPLELQFRELQNRARGSSGQARSQPSSISLTAFGDIFSKIERRVIIDAANSLNQAGGYLGELGRNADLSDFLPENTKKFLADGIRQIVSNDEGGFKREALERTFSRNFSSFFQGAIDLVDFERNRSVPTRGAAGGRDSLSLPEIQRTPSGGIDYLRQYRELRELMEPPRITPGVENQFEGAALPIGDQFMAMLAGSKFSNLASAGKTFANRLGGPSAYPLPAGYPYLPGQGPAATQQVTPPAAPIVETTKPIVELGVQAKTTADGVKDLGTEMSDSVTKFQKTVGIGLQAISSIAMGIGGAQMIRKGGAYNTLMGAASIFGSISSITGMFGTGGGLSGLFGRKPKSSLPGFTGEMLNLGGLGLPGYASGGRPDPYDPAIIGENGPELWVPDRPGTIIPNDELYVPGLDDKGGSAPSIGRYARRAASSMESGDGESGDTIYTGNYGRAVPYQRSETTREIDRLERITTNPKELPPIKYETTRVNEYDFVTPEQLEASNARTAKIARNQTIRELADSMKTRKRLGL